MPEPIAMSNARSTKHPSNLSSREEALRRPTCTGRFSLGIRAEQVRRAGDSSRGLRRYAPYGEEMEIRLFGHASHQKVDLLHFGSSQSLLYTLVSHLRLPVHLRDAIRRHPASSPSVTLKPRAGLGVPDADSFMPQDLQLYLVFIRILQ